MSQKGTLTRYIFNIGIQPLPTPGSINPEALHAFECTHMNNIAFFLHPHLKGKKLTY